MTLESLTAITGPQQYVTMAKKKKKILNLIPIFSTKALMSYYTTNGLRQPMQQLSPIIPDGVVLQV